MKFPRACALRRSMTTGEAGGTGCQNPSKERERARPFRAFIVPPDAYVGYGQFLRLEIPFPCAKIVFLQFLLVSRCEQKLERITGGAESCGFCPSVDKVNRRTER